jgi:membrane associated rhomboid family serine protease
MDDAQPPPIPSPDPGRTGRLTRDAAVTLLERGDDLMAGGEFSDAAAHYARVVGFDDPTITGAALLGLGEAHYRLNNEDAAVQTWSAALQLPENPSTYAAWRNIAAARVRSGDLNGAIDAYREADRRAPLEDKAEIANRLGWLSKETGNTRASRRYFARGRGDPWPISMTLLIIAVTSIISLTAYLTQDGQGEQIYEALSFVGAGIAHGEYWRLWTVTLVHADFLHLGFNMYALWLAGSIVERWYGPWRMLLFYLACAAAGSTLSFVTGTQLAVGASGAIFGLFGVLLTANWLHHPVDRQSRGLVSQLMILVVINIVFGLAPGTNIDNAAHLGGLAAGLWLGAIVPPTRVPTLSSLWQQPANGARRPGPATAPPYVMVVGLVVVGVAVVVGVVYGTNAREASARHPSPAVIEMVAPAWPSIASITRPG